MLQQKYVWPYKKRLLFQNEQALKLKIWNVIVEIFKFAVFVYFKYLQNRQGYKITATKLVKYPRIKILCMRILQIFGPVL